MKFRAFTDCCFWVLVFCLPSQAQMGSWSARSPMPIALSEVGTAAVGGKIYVVGGL